MNQFEATVIAKNIEKLECLETIKIMEMPDEWDNYEKLRKKFDISCFFEAKNLKFLKISYFYLDQINFPTFSKKLINSRLEKLSLKSFIFNNESVFETCFSQLIEAIYCISLKILKLNIALTPNLLEILVSRLRNFINLDYISIKISDDFTEYIYSLSELISLLEEKTMISKVRVNKYIWDIRNLENSKKLEIVGCELIPADLLILDELCKKNILPPMDYLDLSDNFRILGEYFVECMESIIKNLQSIQL